MIAFSSIRVSNTVFLGLVSEFRIKVELLDRHLPWYLSPELESMTVGDIAGKKVGLPRILSTPHP